MSLSHCIHQTLNSKASTRFHSGGLQQSLTLILNTFLFGVIILIANILKRAFSSQLAAKLRTVLSFSKNHFSSPSGRWSIVLLISSWGSTLYHCANSSINFSVTDTNSSRTSEAALWPSTYISPLSN